MSTHDNAPTPPAAAPTTALPPEVREAIAAEIYGTPYASLQASDRLSVDFACAALAPLWPRPAPVTADDTATQEQAYAWQAVWNKLASLPEFGAVWEAKDTGCAHALRTVDALLARAEAAEREAAEVRKAWNEREPQLLAAERDRDQLRAALAETKQEVERLTGVVEARIQEIKHGWSEHDRLRAQLAAAQEDTERLDWLEGGGFDQRVARTFNIWQGGGMKFRAAIDAARREGGAK